MDPGGGSDPVAGLGAGTSNLESASMAGFRFTAEQARDRKMFIEQYAFLKHHNQLGALEAAYITTATANVYSPCTSGLEVPNLQVEAPGFVESPSESMLKPPSCKLGLVVASGGDLELMAAALQHML